VVHIGFSQKIDDFIDARRCLGPGYPAALGRHDNGYDAEARATGRHYLGPGVKRRVAALTGSPQIALTQPSAMCAARIPLST